MSFREIFYVLKQPLTTTLGRQVMKNAVNSYCQYAKADKQGSEQVKPPSEACWSDG